MTTWGEPVDGEELEPLGDTDRRMLDSDAVPDTEPAEDEPEDNDCTACGGSGGGAAPMACPQCGGSGHRVQRTRARRSRDCEEP